MIQTALSNNGAKELLKLDTLSNRNNKNAKESSSNLNKKLTISLKYKFRIRLKQYGLSNHF